ncbi:Radical SAM superfamily protein [Thermoplasmatales archaeon]|nr:Radical SAM superfamily protein [Thermoplasmatales archaeon]
MTESSYEQEEHDKYRQAAIKAWSTIRKNKIENIKKENETFDDYIFDVDSRKISYGTYKINPPLIKKSRLTWVEKGGVGKELSDGWSLNYAVGCTHACRFCYVDSIHKRYGEKRTGPFVNRSWGNYMYLPANMDDAIAETRWEKWKGIEVMMSSTHDPYLPSLVGITKRILEAALPAGVKLCIQTRSPLVEKDLKYLSEFQDQVRVQVSVATMNRELSRIIEPRVASPESRLRILEHAKDHGLNTGIIIAPIMPSLKIRESPRSDLMEIAKRLSILRPDNIYGECLHVRGSNMSELEAALGEKIEIGDFDTGMEKQFHRILGTFGLKGRWWKEHKTYSK